MFLHGRMCGSLTLAPNQVPISACPTLQNVRLRHLVPVSSTLMVRVVKLKEHHRRVLRVSIGMELHARVTLRAACKNASTLMHQKTARQLAILSGVKKITTIAMKDHRPALRLG